MRKNKIYRAKKTYRGGTQNKLTFCYDILLITKYQDVQKKSLNYNTEKSTIKMSDK